MADDRAVRRVAVRSYWREADARVVVEGWRGSGRSLRSYCAERGLHPKRVARWAARIGRGNDGVRFHPVEVVGVAERTGDRVIELELPRGETVRLPSGFAVDDLRRILQVLGERAGC